MNTATYRYSSPEDYEQIGTCKKCGIGFDASEWAGEICEGCSCDDVFCTECEQEIFWHEDPKQYCIECGKGRCCEVVDNHICDDCADKVDKLKIA